MAEITDLLAQARGGDESAPGQLVPLVHERLRELARRLLAAEGSPRALSATALAHELHLEETATALGVGPHSVVRDWKKTRKDDLFVSSPVACPGFCFKPAACTITRDGGDLQFNALSETANGTRMQWKGSIAGAHFDASAQSLRPVQPVVEFRSDAKLKQP